MTKEEAIKELTYAMHEVEWEYPIDVAAALTIAIEALENNEKYRWHDLIAEPKDQPSEELPADWFIVAVSGESNRVKWVNAVTIGMYDPDLGEWLMENGEPWERGLNVVGWRMIEEFRPWEN